MYIHIYVYTRTGCCDVGHALVQACQHLWVWRRHSVADERHAHAGALHIYTHAHTHTCAHTHKCTHACTHTQQLRC